jgi:hypothetical protein
MPLGKLSMCAGGTQPRFSERAEPNPPLPQHRHDVSHISGTSVRSGQISNCQHVPGLQVIQAFLPSCPCLGSAGSVLLKDAHGFGLDEHVDLRIQGLPALLTLAYPITSPDSQNPPP